MPKYRKETEETTPLQIPAFPKKLKNQVQSKAALSDKTLKQATIEMYEMYLKMGEVN